MCRVRYVFFVKFRFFVRIRVGVSSRTNVTAEVVFVFFGLFECVRVEVMGKGALDLELVYRYAA